MPGRRYLYRYDEQNELVAVGEAVDDRVIWSYIRGADLSAGTSPTRIVTYGYDPSVSSQKVAAGDCEGVLRPVACRPSLRSILPRPFFRTV
jgi:hypothetical protein